MSSSRISSASGVGWPRGTLLAVTLLITGGLAVRALLSGDHPTPSRQPSSIIGSTLPEIALPTISGESTDLKHLIGNDGGVVFVVRPDDCAGCANFAAEVLILRRQFPHLSTILVGSGRPISTFTDYARRARLSGISILDTMSLLLDSLDVALQTPLVMVVDGERRVLHVDARPTQLLSRLPASTVFRELFAVMNTRGPSHGERP